MKTPLVKIFRSSSKDMTHYIFRSKENIDNSVDNLITNYKPVGFISEKDDIKLLNRIELTNVTMSINKNPKLYDGFSALSLPFDFCIPGVFFKIYFQNTSDLTDSIVVTLYIGINKIFKVIKEYDNHIETITDTSKIKEEFQLTNNNNCILIKNDIFNYKIASFYGEAEVYYYYDDSLKFDKECVPSKAHGIYKPILNIVKTNNYISFYQEAKNRKNIYYYNIISKLIDNTISDVSNTQVCEIAEPAENIQYKLQSTNLYFTKDKLEESDWKTISVSNPSKEIRINKSELVNNIIPIDNFKIYANDIDLKLQNRRELKITNIWNINNRKLMERDKKVFRGINSCNGIDKISDPIVFDDKQTILIDKILILKKDVTNITDKAKAIALNDPDAKTLKIFVRQGGIYYKDFFLNNNNTNDYDEPAPNYILSSITLDSRFPVLNIEDDCIYGNKYNYTVYLYDELGKTSNPISIVL